MKMHPVDRPAKWLALLGTITLLASLPGCLPNSQTGVRMLHENVARAHSQYNYIDLLSSYGSFFSLIAQGSYQDLPGLLAELSQANLPLELRELFDRYNTLSRQLADALSMADARLNDAAGMIAENRLVEAAALLDQAEARLNDASLTAQDITAANESIEDRLNATAPEANPALRSAYYSLVDLSEHIGGEILRLQALRQSILAEHQTAAVLLTPTALELIVPPGTVSVGERISVAGRLMAEGRPLAQKTIALSLGGQSGAAVTDADGYYQTTLPVPYQYVPSLTLQARYNPQGWDLDTYQAAASSKTLPLYYYRTSLELSLPPELHPGLAFTLQGRIVSDGPALPRQLTVSLGNTVLARSSASASFSLDVTPPANLVPASYPLSIGVAPDGLYAGASATSPILLAQIPLTLRTDVPGLVVAPGAYHVRGAFAAPDGSALMSRVKVTLPDGTDMTTATGGAFDFKVRIPFDLAALGRRALVITVQPAESWYAPASVEVPFYIFNPWDTGLVLLSVLTLTGLGLRAGKRRASDGRTDQTPTVFPPRSTAEAGYTLGGLAAFIVCCYLEARKVVQIKTGTELAPATTLREFLARCGDLLPLVRKAFGELTALAEAALYGREKPGSASASQANEYSRAILERHLHEPR